MTIRLKVGEAMQATGHWVSRSLVRATTLRVIMLFVPWSLSAAPAEVQTLSSESNEKDHPLRPLLHSSGVGFPWVNLRDEIRLSATPTGGPGALLQASVSVHPRSMAAGDFDGDGLTDLVLMGRGNGGPFLRVHPGSRYQTDSIAARTAARLPESLARSAPFEAGYTARQLTVAPELSAVGDFDGDGIDDLVYASRGTPLLYLCQGTATGLSAPEQPFELPGPPVVMVAGEFNRKDGRSDLAVTIESRPDTVFLFQSELGGLGATPVEFTVNGEVLDLRMANLDDYFPVDLFVVTDSGLWVLRGPGSPLSAEGPVVRADRIPCDDRIVTAEVGDFVWDRLHRNDVAVVVEPGIVRFLEFDLPGRGIPPSSMASDQFSAQWTVRKSVGLARSVSRDSRVHFHLTKGRLSTVPLDELVVWDETGPYVQLVYRRSVALAGTSARRESAIRSGPSVAADPSPGRSWRFGDGRAAELRCAARSGCSPP